MTPSNGVTVTAVTQLSDSDISTTWNRDLQNSPVESSDSPIAPNAMMATAVAPSSGRAVWLTTALAADSGSSPCWMRTSIPSMTTMALSTSMPRAMISAPSEMRSRATSQEPMKMKVPTMVSASMKPMISPLRTPMNSSNTATTMATACIRLFRKPSMAVTTASDCREMTPNSMPSGICGASSCMRLEMASPIVTTLPPLTVEMPTPMARLPS